MIIPDDLTGVEESVARRLIAVARSIAPCIDTIDGDDKLTVVAILDGVAAELPAAGSRRVRSQSRNGTSISLADMKSAFSDDDRDALRALCSATPAGLPVGSFPEAGVVARAWPEGDYS